MLLKSKVASLFKVGGKSQKSYCESRDVSVQALSQSLKRESISFKEIVSIADYLGMKVAIYNDTEKVEFVPSDFTPKVDKRKSHQGYFAKVATKKVEAPDLTDFINSL